MSIGAFNIQTWELIDALSINSCILKELSTPRLFRPSPANVLVGVKVAIAEALSNISSNWSTRGIRNCGAIVVTADIYALASDAIFADNGRSAGVGRKVVGKTLA